MRRIFVLLLVLMLNLCAVAWSGDDPDSAAEDVYQAAEEVSQESVESIKARMKFSETWPGEKAEHDFIGVAKCMLCHKTEKQGRQYGIWKDTKHAHAFETLGSPEAKALGAKLGIEDPQTNGKCLRCHSTAYFFGEEKITSVIDVEEGISCESCHGPGKDYMKLPIMKDREKAKAAGLWMPTKETCLKCHNASAPNVKEFDYDHSWRQIKHPVPR